VQQRFTVASVARARAHQPLARAHSTTAASATLLPLPVGPSSSSCAPRRGLAAEAADSRAARSATQVRNISRCSPLKPTSSCSPLQPPARCMCGARLA